VAGACVHWNSERRVQCGLAALSASFAGAVIALLRRRFWKLAKRSLKEEFQSPITQFKQSYSLGCRSRSGIGRAGRNNTSCPSLELGNPRADRTHFWPGAANPWEENS
jgi:hypothetical protein